MQRNYNSLGWRFSQRILRGFVQFLRKLKSKIIQLTLTALNYFKGLEFNMTIFKVLNLVCAQTNSSPLLGGRLQWSEECLSCALGVRPQCSAALKPWLDAQESRMHSCAFLSNKAGWAAQCLSGLIPGIPDHSFPPLHISCHLWLPALWRFAESSLLFAWPSAPQVKLQPRKAPDNNVPLGALCVPLACHTLTSLLSHGHSLQAAPNPNLMSPGPKP